MPVTNCRDGSCRHLAMLSRRSKSCCTDAACTPNRPLQRRSFWATTASARPMVPSRPHFNVAFSPYHPDVLHRLNAGERRLQRACTFQHGCRAPVGLGVAEPRRWPTTQRRITRSPQNRSHRSIDRRQIDAHRVRMTGLRGKPFQDQWIVAGDDVVGAVGEAFQYLEAL
jgi:hypothetical protein